MANKLSSATIKKRLLALRNVQRLYAVARERMAKLEEIIHLQDQQIATQHEQNQLLQQLTDQQAIRIAELEAMVFGKKKKPPTDKPTPKDDISMPPKVPRNKDSFKRAIPSDETVTEIVSVPVDHCACGSKLQNIITHERYVEDIPLPDLTTNYKAKLVTKYLVQRGICVQCGKPTSGQDLGGAVVSLGPNARLLVCHLISTLGMSYSQVVSLFLSLYGLNIDDGEIADILAKQHTKWQPAYQQLLTDIRGSPVVNADESPWAIQDLQGAGYAWVLADGLSPKVCYALENSRGTPHAKKLFGKQFSGVRISDDYGVYRALPGQQQLCWAHLYRCIRDLRYNDNLPEEQLPYVSWWYEQFAAIYEDLRMYLTEPYDKVVRHTQADELWARIQVLVSTTAYGPEPAKLTKLKAQLTRAGQDKLFICLPADTPCDNNRAERDLRGLVIKRKRSFGSKSEKGAQALATVLSICTTTWRMNQSNYFSTLAALA